jgi:class 3 adenylate cyclase/tetratricopeptide (TPR) repeat protein
VVAATDTLDERTDANRRLTPYVPRLVIDWLRSSPEAVASTVEGSLLFADISGFTKLSEALARRGKVGAELMRDALNDVFTALLDDAYDYGAGLIKWGGDALLLLFDGADHEVRACRAAWEMQQTLARVGRLRAPGGTVVLRMSVGITSGPVQFFLVGGIHRELLVAGPTATEVVVTEGIADAGEIALSRALAGRLDKSLRGGRKEGAVLLARAPEAQRERAPDVGDVSGVVIAECIPLAARAHVLLDRSEPEHRTITAAFIDLIGTDDLLAELGADALAAEFDQRLRTIQEAALTYEVPFYETDVGNGSVKVLLTAGAPSGTGRDEEAMLRTLREIVEAPGLIPIRVGVNTGKVFAGDFGPPYRRAYRVFGDAINTAARVMSRAAAGQILATEAVLERSRTIFETTPIEPFAAKGKALPIHASIVGREAGTRERTWHREAVFAARKAELRMLLQVIESARGGEGWTIELSGRPGLGKSHLIDELIARSPDLAVFRGRCDRYQSTTPYFPLRSVLRMLVGASPEATDAEIEAALRAALAEHLPGLMPWLPVMAIPFGLELPGTPESEKLEGRFLRERLADLLDEFLAVMFHGRLAMVLIEDVQYVDEATTDLLSELEQIARREGGRGWILFMTQNDPKTSAVPQRADAIEAHRAGLCLLPLSFDATCDLVNLVTEDEPLAPHVVEEIARRSGGNLLFLFELLDHARSTRSLAGLPDSVEAFFAAEIDRLAPRDRDLVRYASVLGASFDPELLAAAMRDELVLEAATWARLGELVEPDPNGGLRFANGLIRDTAYEGLPYRRRRQLHAWLAEAIEARAGDRADDEAAMLSLHFGEAQEWGKAWHYARRAADRAREVYANVEAAAALERAIASGRRVRGLGHEALAGAYEGLGDACFALGEFDRAARAFGASKRLLGRGSPRAAELSLKEALIPMRFGNYPQTLRRLSRGLHELEQVRGRGAAAGRSRLCARYAAVRFRQNRNRESIAWSVRAQREARQGRAPDALAYAYMINDMALLAEGTPEAATHGPDALAIYEQLGDLVWQAATLNNMGLLAYELGHWSESLALYARAGTIWESTGDRWSATFAKYNRGEILSDQGHFDQAEEQLRGALRVWRAAGSAPEIAQATRQLGRLAARRGDFETADRLLESARDQQVANAEASEAVWTDAWILEAHLLSGSGEACVEQVEDLRARAQKLDPGGRMLPLLQRLRGWALLTTGAVDDAAAAFQLGLDQVKSRHQGFESAALLEGAQLAARARSGADQALETGLEVKLVELGIVVRPAARLRVPASAREA